jgi:hypothetical protein
MAINADKLLNKSSGRLAMQKAQQEKMVGGGPANIVLSKKSIKGIESIKINVIKIEDILKGSLALDKKQLDDKKKATSKKRKDDIETKLETKPSAENGKVKMPSAPRMGILDFIKNFIGNVLLGYFAVRLIKHLPKIMPIVKFLGNATDFIINTGGELLNGLVTFIDIGYKAYDATRGFIKNLGGENFAKGFDKFIGAIDTALFLTTVLAGSMALEAMSGGGGGPGGGRGGEGNKTYSGGRQRGFSGNQGSTLAKRRVLSGGSRGFYFENSNRDIMKRYFQKYGRDQFIQRFGQDGLKKLPGGMARSGATNLARKGLVGLAGKGGAKMVLGFARPLLKRLPIIGALIDFGLSVALGEDPGRAAFKAIGAGLLGTVGAAIGSLAFGFGGIVGGILGSIGGDALGGALYDTFFGGKKPQQKGKVQGKAGGGITRGGRSRGRVKRTLSKGKYKRVLAPQKPSKTEFKDKEVKKSTEELDKTKYFGPILAVSSKIMNKEEPTQRDYQNVGLGINLLIAKGIQDKQLKGGIVAAFANGGFVDPDVLSAAETGGDISSWVAKTFRGAIETGAQRTMRLMKEMREEKKVSPGQEPGVDMGGGGSATDAIGGARLFMAAGFPMLAAAILAGNIQAESAWKGQRTPWVLNDGAGTNKGLISWNRSRIVNGEKFLGKPLETASNAEQVRWIKEELRQYGLLDEFMDPTRTEAQLKSDSYKYIGWGIEGDRWKQSARILAALEKGEQGTFIPGSASPLGTQVGNLSEAKSIAESMRVPLYSHVRKDNPNSFHYDGRAMDFSNDGVGNGTPQQLSLANEFVRKYGATAKEIFYTPLGYSIKDGKKVSTIAASTHYNHVHIAFAKGGRIHKPIIAMIGEKGPEFVFDANTTAGLDKLAPQLLEKLNFASTKPQLASILQSYAPYDASASSQTIVVQSPSVPSGGRNNNSSGGGVAVIPIPVDNFTEILAMIG